MTEFHHVRYLWDEKKEAELKGDEVALLIYRSNLLGSDLRITNYGGGNTSCKLLDKDPLTGLETEVMWIKGSGGDLGTLKKNGLSALYLERLLKLKSIYKGLAFEDEMVALMDFCIFQGSSKAPSIDTPLHGFLPFSHIDHLHPDAAIAIAAAKNGEQITREIFNGTMGWVDWQRPGFDLGLKLRACLEAAPEIRGIMLGSHGLFTWANTAKQCYQNSLEVIEICASYLQKKIGKVKPIFGGQKIQAMVQPERFAKAALIAPVLRGLVSADQRKIGHFTDSEELLQFINSHDLDRLAPMGTSCPDHFLRTKISPLVLRLGTDEDFGNALALREKLEIQIEAYRKMYKEYYTFSKHPGSPAMRDPNPVILLWPGIGMFSFAKDKQTARVAAEFYLNAINVMKGAEAISEYIALPRQEAFDIEYWLLEEAKLQRMPAPKSLSGRIALVTGSAGGIGRAIAKKFAEEGACVLINDNDALGLEKTGKEFEKHYGKDLFATEMLDVTDATTIKKAYDKAGISFGGVDIIVNCAGISISKSLEQHTENDWDLLYDILVKGQFLVTQKGAEIMRNQGLGGDVINIVSKNALVSGPNNAGYGSAKSAQLHLSRLNAAELGKDKIRVNVVNPDAVISDSKIWAGAWAEGRAKAYGIAVEELPVYYAKRTLLNEIILPEDIANACFVFVGGLMNKSTGNVLNVDGGVAMAFLR